MGQGPVAEALRTRGELSLATGMGLFTLLGLIADGRRQRPDDLPAQDVRHGLAAAGRLSILARVENGRKKKDGVVVPSWPSPIDKRALASGLVSDRHGDEKCRAIVEAGLKDPCRWLRPQTKTSSAGHFPAVAHRRFRANTRQHAGRRVRSDSPCEATATIRRCLGGGVAGADVAIPAGKKAAGEPASSGFGRNDLSMAGGSISTPGATRRDCTPIVQ